MVLSQLAHENHFPTYNNNNGNSLISRRIAIPQNEMNFEAANTTSFIFCQVLTEKLFYHGSAPIVVSTQNSGQGQEKLLQYSEVPEQKKREELWTIDLFGCQRARGVVDGDKQQFLKRATFESKPGYTL